MAHQSRHSEVCWRLGKDSRSRQQEVDLLTGEASLGSTFDVLMFKTRGLPDGPGAVRECKEPCQNSIRPDRFRDHHNPLTIP